MYLPIKIEIKNYEERTPYSPGDPSSPLKKVKFFIYGATLLKFEIEHFHILVNNN